MKANKCVNWLDKFLEKFIILAMFALLLTIVWQVFSRYLLKLPSSGTEELARFLLIWISLIGCVYSYRTKSHIGLDILTRKMPIEQQKSVALFCHAIVFLFASLVLVVGGSHLVSLTFSPVQVSAALGVFIGFVYSIIPISGYLICFYALVQVTDIMLDTTVSSHTSDYREDT